ncbi:hypothetical protein KUTeg_018430 [Tegillarca granosa]|uniref:Glutaredoxin-like protein n=1 Tax=Tegillarca granosa TaxID=220873 RepID=A0ABQ9ELR0_TEGGR|nr:hypothetical protein KUTeg_018430 [Tegillarca granosa]
MVTSKPIGLHIVKVTMLKFIPNILKQKLYVIQPQIVNYVILSNVRTYSNTTDKLPTLTLYTKDDCPLCDEAKILLTPLSHRYKLEEVDIMLPENKEWYKKYRYDIPVFHFEGRVSYET